MRLDVLPTPRWPLADVLLGAAVFAAKHALPVAPLCAAYLQLLAWRSGHWAHVYKYGVAVGERGLVALGAVKIVEGRKTNGAEVGKEEEGPERGTSARLDWAVDRLATWWDPLTGWRGTSEMTPEDRYWRYVSGSR
jgi:hypothetical protein